MNVNKQSYKNLVAISQALIYSPNNAQTTLDIFLKDTTTNQTEKDVAQIIYDVVSQAAVRFNYPRQKLEFFEDILKKASDMIAQNKNYNKNLAGRAMAYVILNEYYITL